MQTQTAHRATATDAARLDVGWFKLTTSQLCVVKVGLWGAVGGAEVVDLLDHIVKEGLEYLVAVLVPEDTASLLAVELVAGIVYSSLDALVKGHAIRGHFVPQLLVDGKRQMRCHDIVVLAQIGVVCLGKLILEHHWISFGQEGIDGLASSQGFVHFDEFRHSIDHQLNQLSLRLAQTSQVGKVIGGVFRQRRFTAGSALAKLEGSQDVVKALVLLEVDEAQMHGAAHHGAEVGGACADVAQALVVHEGVAPGFHQILDLSHTASEAAEHSLHVSTLLHGDDTDVILLVHPDKEVLVVVVPDATTLWPITGTARGREEGTGRLLKQEVVVDELLHGLVVHGGQGVVLASQVTAESTEGIRHDVLDHGTFGTRHSGWQTQTAHRATATDAARLAH